jgi:hypothetical protein
MKPLRADSFEASVLSIPMAESGNRRLLAARLRHSTVTLTDSERKYLADLCENRLARRKGHPRHPDILKLWVASDAIRFEERSCGRAQMGTVSDDTVKHVAQVHGCSERSVRDHLSFAKQYQDGVWWIDTCERAHIWEKLGNAVGTSTGDGFGASVAASFESYQAASASL